VEGDGAFFERHEVVVTASLTYDSRAMRVQVLPLSGTFPGFCQDRLSPSCSGFPAEGPSVNRFSLPGEVYAFSPEVDPRAY